METKITIPKHRTVYTTGELSVGIFKRHLDMKGFLTIKTVRKRKLQGSVSAPPKAFINATINIEEAPKREIFGMLVKDAYVDNNSPDVNTGLSKVLHYDKEQVTFLQWDFSKSNDSFYQPENEDSTYLRLYITRTQQKPSTVKIYSTSTDWLEYEINYNNSPETQLLQTYTIPANTVGWIKIPLYGLLYNLDKTKQNSIALAVNTDDLYFTPSKEQAEELAPKLSYDYRYYPPKLERSGIRGLLNVRIDTERKCEGLLIVDSFNIGVSTEGMIKVPRFDSDNIIKMNGSLRILKGKQVYSQGIIYIPFQKKEASLKGVLQVAQKSKSSITGLLNIPTEEGKKSFNGVIKVQLGTQASLKGVLNVSIFNKESEIHGEITIELNKKLRMSGLLDIPRQETSNQMNGLMVVLAKRIPNFEGQITIPTFKGETSFKGSLFVPHSGEGSFQGTINIPFFEPKDKPKMDGTIRVLKKESSEMSGLLVIIPDIIRQYVYIV